MGCSTSKGCDSPVKRSKEGWESVLPKEFSLHLERSVKSTEMGYITAIFSANYSNMRMNSLARSDDPSLAIQPSGVSHQTKVSKVVGTDTPSNRLWCGCNGGGSLRKAWPDLSVGVSKLASESKQVIRATMAREGPAETINTWELMQGLEDDAELPSLNEQKPLSMIPASNSTVIDEKKQALADCGKYSSVSVPASPKSSSFPRPALLPESSIATAGIGVPASPARPRSFSSIRSVEDVDAHIAGRSRIPPPAWPGNSTKIQPSRHRDGDQWRLITDTSSSSSSSLDRVVSAREEATSLILRDQSDWSPNNLQRALSFKYIFSNDSTECHNIPGDGSVDFHGIQSDATPSTCGSAACLTGSSKQGGPSFRPSPEFSGAAGLKEWLPVFGSLNQSEAVHTGARRSLLGALEGCSNPAGESSLLQRKDLAPNRRNSGRGKPLVNKYGRTNDQLPERTSTKGSNCFSPKLGGGDDQLQGSSRTNDLGGEAPSRFSSASEGSESPVFCAEALRSLEHYSKSFSEEKWYTVTSLGSESESPRELLRLLESSRRSSSKSMDGNNTTTTGDRSATSSEKKVMDDGLKSATGSKPMDNSSSKIHTGEDFSITRGTGETKRVSSESAGGGRIVLYSTTWQSSAQAYEDCTTVKTILLSLGTSFDERNISVHAEYEKELDIPAIVPTLRVNGRCFVGLDGILQLHRKGLLGALLREAEGGENLRAKTACLCRGGKFLICPSCKGKRKVGACSCRNCSGTGLIKCPNCSSF